MTDKLMTVEEIAEDVIQKIRERNGLDHLYGVKDVKIALLSFAKREAEPLVEALEFTLGREVFPKGVTAADVETEAFTVVKKALTAWREKYGEGKK